MSSLFLLICYNLKPQMYLKNIRIRVVGFKSNSHLFKGLTITETTSVPTP